MATPLTPNPEQQENLAKVHAELKESALAIQQHAAVKVRIEYFSDAMLIFFLAYIFSSYFLLIANFLYNPIFSPITFTE
jgi:hypothetical protein